MNKIYVIVLESFYYDDISANNYELLAAVDTYDEAKNKIEEIIEASEAHLLNLDFFETVEKCPSEIMINDYPEYEYVWYLNNDEYEEMCNKRIKIVEVKKA